MSRPPDSTAPPLDAAAIRREMEAILVRVGAAETDGVEDLRRLLERSPDHVEIMGHLAWCVARRGDYEEAIRLYERCLVFEPEDVEVWCKRADRLVNLGRLDEAQRAYEEIARDHPDCLDAVMGIRYVRHLRLREKAGRLRETPRRAPPTDRQTKNEALNQKEFQRGALALRSMPPRLFLETTTKCNFYCRTCAKGYGAYFAEDLRPDIREKVRRELMPFALSLSLTGFGEPTLAESFNSLLRMALEHGAQVHFTTNASVLHFERLDLLAQCAGAVQISVDGATKETFESIRAGGRFELLLDKLAMIKKARDIHLSPTAFSFNFVCLRKNIHELPDVVRLAHRFSIPLVFAEDYGLMRTEFDDQSLRYDPERANRWLREARRVAQEHGVDLRTPPLFETTPPRNAPGSSPSSSRKGKAREGERFLSRIPLFSQANRFPQRCASPWREPYIQTNGVVHPCCVTSHFLGDMRTHSFSRIWNGRRYRWFRFRIGSPLPPLCCRECFVSWGINGGNPANAKSREGLFVKAAYFLEIRLGRWWDRGIRWLRRRGLVKRHEPANPPPNYERGRPIRGKS